VFEKQQSEGSSIPKILAKLELQVLRFQIFSKNWDPKVIKKSNKNQITGGYKRIIQKRFPIFLHIFPFENSVFLGGKNYLHFYK
jgi:hypothetical protein